MQGRQMWRYVMMMYTRQSWCFRSDCPGAGVWEEGAEDGAESYHWERSTKNEETTGIRKEQGGRRTGGAGGGGTVQRHVK